MTSQSIILSQIPIDELDLLIEQAAQRAVRKVLSEQAAEKQNAEPDLSESPDVNLDILCQRYKWPKATVYTWVHHNTIPHAKIGKRLYFNIPEIDRWITSAKRKTKTEIDAEADRFITNRQKR